MRQHPTFDFLNFNCNMSAALSSMTKKEIIESLALGDVPPGSQLVEHEVGDFTVSHHQGIDVGGLKIMLAELIIGELTDETAEFPDVPNADLLQRLYEAFLNYHRNLLLSGTMEGVDEDIKLNHCQMVLRLRDISKRLNIPFKEPDDSILR
jgi:hypothetical protein